MISWMNEKMGHMIISSQKLGQQAKYLKKTNKQTNLVYTKEVTVLAQYSRKIVKCYLDDISGHVGSKTRSPSKIC